MVFAGNLTKWISASHCASLTLSWMVLSLPFMPQAAQSQLSPIGEVTFIAAGGDPAIAAAPDGSYVVAWSANDGDGAGIFLRRFAASGSPLGDAQLVNSETTGHQQCPEIAFLQGGGFVVVWSAHSTVTNMRWIHGQRFDAAGIPVGTEFSVNVTTDTLPSGARVAAASDGGFLVAWSKRVLGDLYFRVVARRFDSNGQPLSDEITMDLTSDGSHGSLNLDSDASGNFVLVWTCFGESSLDASVVARRADAMGQPIGGEIEVNVFTAGDQDSPRVAVRQDGTFLVTWRDDTQDAGQPAIYGRLFSAIGVPAGDEFQVDAGIGSATVPHPAFEPSGTFLVFWSNIFSNGSGPRLVARQFDSTGMPLGDAVLISSPNELTTGGIRLSIPRGRATGFAVWRSDGGQGGNQFDVYGRRFGLSLFSDGFESGDASAWSLAVPGVEEQWNENVR
ncbi:MAG: hypothetical protein K0U98_05730 [Deltaproteobacteria bacterium]|nr:hypothetical protein [Deltaproteobacteria bacterium]